MRLSNIKNYKYKNIVVNIVILLNVIVFYLLIYQFDVKMECIFKKITGFSCPACGLSRAFYELFNFNFLNAFKYNILTIPLFIFIVISVVWLLIDIYRNKSNYNTFIINFLNKHYIYIFIILFITMIINNVNKI